MNKLLFVLVTLLFIVSCENNEVEEVDFNKIKVELNDLSESLNIDYKDGKSEKMVLDQINKSIKENHDLVFLKAYFKDKADINDRVLAKIIFRFLTQVEINQGQTLLELDHLKVKNMLNELLKSEICHDNRRIVGLKKFQRISIGEYVLIKSQGTDDVEYRNVKEVECSFDSFEYSREDDVLIEGKVFYKWLAADSSKFYLYLFVNKVQPENSAILREPIIENDTLIVDMNFVHSIDVR